MINYPEYISSKLSDKILFQSLIDECYKNDFIDLKKYHKEKSISPYFNGSINDLSPFKIEKEEFGCENINEFWFTQYDNLLFLFNGDILIPCSGIIKRENDYVLSIYYIPKVQTIQCNKPIFFDVLFYDKIIKSIVSIEILKTFINDIKYYHFYKDDENIMIGYLSRFVLNSNFTFIEKINLLNNIKSLNFFTLLYFIKKNTLDLNIETLINTFYYYDSKEKKNIITITKTTTEIFSQDEIINILVKILKNNDDVLEFFNYNLIEEYLKNRIVYLQNKNSNSYEDETSYLSSDFFSFIKINNSVQKDRNYGLEKNISENFDKFKLHYYRTILPKLRKIENEIRIEKGFNIVGSYTNESILYVKLKNDFDKYEVVSQGTPKWLGRQRIDIYLPEFNIGVEYQGLQHYLPIPFFGGEEGLKQRNILDKRKFRLCEENGCYLVIVDENYNYEEVKLKIKQQINKLLFL
jgi:hypothetical protein